MNVKINVYISVILLMCGLKNVSGECVWRYVEGKHLLSLVS